MGRELAERFPVAAQTFAEADAALGFPLSRLCFEGPEEDLRLTENTQPAIMTVSIAAARVLAEHGVDPALAAGHSLGEWSAHVVAGTLSFADAVRSVKARGKAMQQAVPAGPGRHGGRARARCRAGGRGLPRSRTRNRPDGAGGQPQLAGADGHLRRGSRGREGFGAVQGERRAAGSHAPGKRSLPLRADAARAGGSGAGAGRDSRCTIRAFPWRPT